MPKRFTQLHAPFWSKIPVLGLATYPHTKGSRIIFWFSASVYALIYFFCIALVVVTFTHSLYGWSGFRNYITTALYDVMYKNFALVIVFVGIEAWLMYRQAVLKQKKAAKSRQKRSLFGVFLYPVLFVVVMYVALKILTHHFSLEPNALPVLAGFYVFFVVITYIINLLPSLDAH